MPLPKNLVPLRRYQHGPILQELTVSHLNEAVGELDDLRRDYAENFKGPQDDGGIHQNYTLAVITNTGPNGEADDPAHNVYWLKTQRVKSTVKVGDSVELEDETTPGIWEIVQATNLAEAKTSHSMRTDETVFVKLYRLQGSSSPGSGHRIFWAGAPANFGIANVEVLHAHGKYTAQLRTPFTDGTDVTITDNIEDTAAYNDGSVAIILVNLAERELGSEVLAVGEDYPCWYLQTNSDGTPVYVTYAHDRGLIEVDLTESGTGGAIGTSSAPSSWTYDVTALNGQQILSNVSPEIPRPNGSLAKATRGLAYYRIRLSGSAALPVWRPVLLYAFEIPGTAPCVSP